MKYATFQKTKNGTRDFHFSFFMFGSNICKNNIFQDAPPQIVPRRTWDRVTTSPSTGSQGFHNTTRTILTDGGTILTDGGKQNIMGVPIITLEQI